MSRERFRFEIKVAGVVAAAVAQLMGTRGSEAAGLMRGGGAPTQEYGDQPWNGTATGYSSAHGDNDGVNKYRADVGGLTDEQWEDAVVLDTEVKEGSQEFEEEELYNLPDSYEPQGEGLSSVNEPISPEEMDFYSLSRQGYADSLKRGSRVIDLSPNFERHKEGDLVFAMPKEVINPQGVVIPLHVGDSRNFNSPSRRLRIVFNEEDFPSRLPPILFDIPGGYTTGTMFGMAEHNRGQSWMKVRPLDGSEPLEVSIFSRSADGTETSLTSDEIAAVGTAQGAIAASNRAKSLYAGDPVSGRVNAMTGIRMHDPAHRNHILDLHHDMPISREAEGVTVDLESYLYEFFATGASLDVIVDATRFSTVPVRFVDGEHRVELEVDGGRVRMTSSRSSVQPIDVGFQGRGSDGVLRGLPEQSLLDYVEMHNRGVDTSRSASQAPGASPESVITVTIPRDRGGQENRSI